MASLAMAGLAATTRLPRAVPAPLVVALHLLSAHDRHLPAKRVPQPVSHATFARYLPGTEFACRAFAIAG
jgi:hypothetical protein